MGVRRTVDEDFALSALSARSRPAAATRAYGRTEETRRLEQAFEAASNGETRTVFVLGPDGSGKSFLVRAFLRSLPARGQRILEGSSRGREREPYGVWRILLDTLCQQLLGSGKFTAERSRRRIHTKLSGIARCLVDLAPDFSLLLGDVSPIPPLGPSAAQARLCLAIQRLLRAVRQPRTPTVLFIDDLQACDEGSHRILEDLLTSPRLGGLLAIVACQADGGASSLLARNVIDALTRRGLEPERIQVGPLPRDAAVQTLQESLQLEDDDARELVELLEPRTGTHPLMLRQFVDYLYERGLLEFRAGKGFVWDRDLVRNSEIPESIAGLISARIARLAEAERTILAVSSCMRAPLDCSAIASVAGLELARVEAIVERLCEQGVLAARTAGLEFSHARIRSSCQVALTPDRRVRLHVDLAREHLRTLAGNTPSGEQAAEITDHLLCTADSLPEDLRSVLIDFELIAGQSKAAAGAWAHAYSYLEDVCRRMSHNPTAHSSRVEAHLLASECAYRLRRFQEASDTLDDVAEEQCSAAECVQLALKRIQVLSVTQTPEACTAFVVDVLRSFGIRWPEHPSLLRVWVATQHIRWRIHGKDSSRVLHRAESIDLAWLAPVLLLAPAGAVLLRTNVRLVMLASALALRRYLRYGYVSRPGFTIAAHAYVSFRLLRDGRYARHCMELAEALDQQAPDPVYHTRTRVLFHGTLLPHLEDRRKAVAPLSELADSALELGDIEFSSYARFLRGLLLALAGDPVELVHQRLQSLSQWVKSMGHSYPEAILLAEAYAILREPRPNLDVWSSEADEKLRQFGELPYIRTLWAMILCLHHRFDLALVHSDALGERLHLVGPFVHVADHSLYRGLACGALARRCRGRQRRLHVRQLRRSITWLRRWAREGPDFVHMLLMLEAESALTAGRSARAGSLFEAAARRAQRQEFLHHAAFAHERCAELRENAGRTLDAQRSRAQARELYDAWGALSKLSLFDRTTGSAAGPL